MVRKSLKILGVLLGVVVTGALGLTLHAKWLLERDYAHVPEPSIVADVSPAGIARGEVLFESLCMECHGGADGRATGKRLDEVPAFLGTFWSANLAHPQHGVRRRSDGQLARVLRSGVLPDGRLSVVMNSFGKLGDADVAAILGYMRSGAAVFAPSGESQPRSQPSLALAVIAAFVAKVDVRAEPALIPVPPKAPSVAYGRYMVQAMDCVGCHTAGFASDKMNAEDAFAGGFELTDPTGAPIFSRNITFDAQTGIGRWSRADFERAVTRGVRPDGLPLRKPMPLFSRLDATDVQAIYAFLETMPKVKRQNQAGGQPLHKPRADEAPARMFVSLGCQGCHGEGAPYHDEIGGALPKPDAEVASWILDPQAIKPGSTMPSFEGAIDRAQAEQLAKYVKQLALKRGG